MQRVREASGYVGLWREGRGGLLRPWPAACPVCKKTWRRAYLAAARLQPCASCPRACAASRGGGKGDTLNPSRGEKLATGACCCRSARSNCADHHALTSCRGGWRGWEEVLADEGNVSTYGSDLEAWLSDVRKVPRNAIAAAKDRVRLAAGPWRQVTCPGGSKWRPGHTTPPHPCSLRQPPWHPALPAFLRRYVALLPASIAHEVRRAR